MASFVFPNNPTDDQLVVNSDTGLTYRWIANPGKWVIQTVAEPTIDALPLTGGTMLGPIVFSADQPTGTDTTANILQLVDGTVDNSATKAASAASVKTTYDLATAALPGTGGVVLGNLTVKQSADGASDGRFYVKDYTNKTNFSIFSNGSLETDGSITNISTVETFKIRAHGVNGKGIEFLTGVNSQSLSTVCLFNNTNIESFVPFHTRGTGISVQSAGGTTMVGMDTTGSVTLGGYLNLQNSQNVKQIRTYGGGVGNALVFFVGADENSLSRVVDFDADGVDVSVPVGGGISGTDDLLIGSGVNFTADNSSITYSGSLSTSFDFNTSIFNGSADVTFTPFSVVVDGNGNITTTFKGKTKFQQSGTQTILYTAADAADNDTKVLRFASVATNGVVNNTLDLTATQLKAYKELYIYDSTNNEARISTKNAKRFHFSDEVNDFMTLSASDLTLKSPAIFEGSTFSVERGCSANSNTTNFHLRGFTETAQEASTAILTIKRSTYGDTINYMGRNDSTTALATMGDLTNSVDGLTLTTGLTLTNAEIPSTGALRFKLQNSNSNDKRAYILFQGGGRADGTGQAEYIFGRDTVVSNVDPNKDIWFKLIAPYGSYGEPSTEFVQPIAIPTATAANHAISKGDVEDLIGSLGENVGDNPHYTGTFVKKSGDVMTDTLYIKTGGEQKNAFSIKDASGGNFCLNLWCPGGSGTQVKYVGRFGTDHWFTNYHSEDTLVNNTAKFGYGNYHFYASDIVQYNATDAHYFKGSIYVNHGAYENFRVHQDGTMYGREGMVPTIDRAIANKKYVDDRTPTSTSAVEGLSKRGAVCTTSETTQLQVTMRQARWSGLVQVKPYL